MIRFVFLNDDGSIDKILFFLNDDVFMIDFVVSLLGMTRLFFRVKSLFQEKFDPLAGHFGHYEYTPEI